MTLNYLASRGYDYVEVLKWFAEKVDLILLLFDAHKLDISDEMRDAVQALRLNEEKIRIVLNKADMIDTDQGGNSIGFKFSQRGVQKHSRKKLRCFYCIRTNRQKKSILYYRFYSPLLLNFKN